MPVYEYACEKCGHEFEREQRITDDPVKTCPQCRARRVRRLISQTSFVLKGSGWYSDLYSSSKSKSEPGSEGKESGTSDKDTGSTEAKPSAAGDSKKSEPKKEAGAPGKKKGKGSKAA